MTFLFTFDGVKRILSFFSPCLYGVRVPVRS